VYLPVTEHGLSSIPNLVKEVVAVHVFTKHKLSSCTY